MLELKCRFIKWEAVNPSARDAQIVSVVSTQYNVQSQVALTALSLRMSLWVALNTNALKATGLRFAPLDEQASDVATAAI
jgi:hypothetical protein